MDKAIKQRLLGGLVLVAGAALFLPILLDGEGAPLTVPPMPAAPAAATVAQVAPGLDAEVAQAEASVQAAQAGSTYEDVPAGTEEDVAPDAAALVPEVAATAPAAASVAAPAPDAAAKLAADKAAADKITADRAAADKLAAQKAAASKLEKEKADKARQSADAKAAAEKNAAAKLASEKAAAEKLAAEKAAAEKAAAAKKAAEAKTAPLPDAWVVQVASLSSKDKADALVRKLRQKNYRATAHQQAGVWKVTVGPELRRDVADSIKARLAADAELKLSGFVLPYKP